MEDVIFEIEGDPRVFNDGRERKLVYSGHYAIGRGDETVVILTHHHSDDDGNEVATTIPITYKAYEPIMEVLKEAFENASVDDREGEAIFEIREPIENP